MNLVTQTLLGAGRMTPTRAAVITADGRRVTFADIDQLSAQLAHVLTRRGVTMGDRVAVQETKSPELLALHIACIRAGAIYVPLNTSYTDVEVLALLDEATPSLVVRSDSIAHVTPRIGLAQLVDEARDASETFHDVSADAETPAAMLFTSGTTGRPKGAVLTHGNLAFNCRTLNDVWGFSADDVVLHVLPLFHTHGLFVGAYCALSSGASMLLMERFDVDEVVRSFAHATLFMGVPTHYQRLVADARLNKDSVSSIRLFLSGSAPMLASTHREFAERTGRQIVERYGMTETGIITSNPIDGALKVGTVGPALPGVMVRVAGAPVGVIEVKGPNVFTDYWHRPELRETEFTADGWFKTGDLGSLDDEGYLTIVGRAKDVIISGGLNVHPKEVEQVIDSFPGIRESAVIGLPDADLGEMVTAVVVLTPGVDFDEVALGVFARTSLAGYKVPKRFVVVNDLPRNTMGKVQKFQLRRQFAKETFADE